MAIQADNTAEASDFINKSEADATPANDNGRVPKLEQYNGIERQIHREFIKSNIRYGGDGSDGALVITSGITTVDLGGERVVILNYSSISITGTGKLAFSNPHSEGTIVVIKCAGDAELTSSAAPMIDLEGTGADAGGGGTRSTGPANTAGGDGTDGKTAGYFKTNKGTSTAGGAVATLAMTLWGGGVTGDYDLMAILAKYPHLFLGAGGNGGRATVQTGSGVTTGGDGGRGGGCLIMEIAGAINFTTANGISVAGQDGEDGVAAGASGSNGGGGGGGGGGFAYITYNVETAFTGTIKKSGGVGGNCIVQGSTNGQGGSGGGSLTNAGQTGTSSSTNGAKTGGDGGAGLEYHGLNIEFA